MSSLAFFDCLSISFINNLSSLFLWPIIRNFARVLFRAKKLNEMKNLKLYDPNPEKSFAEAKIARLKQEHTVLNVPVDIETVATNQQLSHRWFDFH